MFKNTSSFKGRIGRLEYILSFIFVFGLGFGLYFFNEFMKSISKNNTLMNACTIIIELRLLWFLLAQGAKRCHDMGKSGWNQVNPFFQFIMLFGGGDYGRNKYGSNQEVTLEPESHITKNNTSNVVPDIINPSSVQIDEYEKPSQFKRDNNRTRFVFRKYRLQLIISLGAIILFILILKIGSSDDSSSDTNKQGTKEFFARIDKSKNMELALRMAANEINKSCPIMVDKESRLNNVGVISAGKIIYNYTLISYDRELFETDTAKYITVEELRISNEPIVINMVKTSPTVKFFRENMVTMVYHYCDKNGLFLFEIEVTPDKYNN